MDYGKVMDFLMARGALQKAAGATPAAAAPTNTDPSYLQQAIAANPNNRQPAPYETQLTPQEEIAFQQWKAKVAPRDTGEDYDLRGAFKASQGTDARGHMTDQFKKPNHPSFSTESQYSTPDNPGGQWINRDNNKFFVPSAANLTGRSFEDLQGYFNKVEPEITLMQNVGPQRVPAGINALKGGRR